MIRESYDIREKTNDGNEDLVLCMKCFQEGI